MERTIDKSPTTIDPGRGSTRCPSYPSTVTMFSSTGGSSSSRRPPNDFSAKTKKPSPPKLYRPSIYTYTCRGYYFAASDASDGNEGICKGIKSQLEVLENQELMTRAEALKRFSTVSTDFTPEEQGEQIQQAIYMSPVLVFKDKTKKGSFDEDYLPTEELINRETFTCYGSTEVEYLVLQDTDQPEKNHFVAVGPRNTGISIRELETDDSVRNITRVGLGFLDIIHDSNTITTHEQQGDLSREEVPERSSSDTVQEAKEALMYCYDFSRKVAEHTTLNAAWLYENMQEDFPRRTYNAGTRIVAELPRICEKTAQNMGNILRRMISDDYEDED